MLVVYTHLTAQMADLQKEAIAEAYEDVRNDSTTTTWLVVQRSMTIKQWQFQGDAPNAGLLKCNFSYSTVAY